MARMRPFSRIGGEGYYSSHIMAFIGKQVDLMAISTILTSFNNTV